MRADTANTLAIANFSPVSGLVGSKITISGNGFSTTASANAVTFNGLPAAVTAATSTSLNVMVPSGASTGPIAVSNANGSAVSATNFIVSGATQPPSIASFSPTIGAAGTQVTVLGANFGAAKSDNNVTFNGMPAALTSSTAAQLVATVPLQGQSGKITVATANGSASTSDDFYVLPSGVTASSVVATQRIVVDGAPVSPNIATAGANALLIFDAKAGQQIGLGITGTTVAPSGSSTFSFKLYGPTGTVLTSCSVSGATKCALPAMPQTGSYRLLVTIDTTHTGSVALLLSSAQTAVLTPDAAATTFATTRAGQSARYTFTGTAGQSPALLWSGATFVGAYSYITIYGPDGVALSNTGTFSNSYNPAARLEIGYLKTSGTYTVVVAPYGASTGQVAVQLVSSTGGALAIDGAVLPISQAAGTSGRYVFSGTTGQHLGLGLNNLVFSPSGGSATVSVTSPDNSTTLVSCGSYTINGNCDLPVLPSSGTYTVVVVPSTYATTVVGELTLSSDLTGTLVADAAASVFATTRVGQDGRYIFNAAAGQNLTLAWNGLTFSGSYSTLTVYNPSGVAISTQNLNMTSYASGRVLLTNLQQTGAYTVVMDPYGASVGQVSLQLLSPTGGALVVDGAALPISQPGGTTGRYTFTGTAGQQLGLGLSALSTTPTGGSVAISVISPDNLTVLISCGTYTANASCNLPVLPSSGTYTVQVVAGSTVNALTANLTLSNPLSGTLEPNAAATVFATTRTGQNGMYSFTGTAGQSLSLALTGTTFVGSYSYLYVYAPDGTLLASQYFDSVSYPSGRIQLANLQQSGVYKAMIDPYAASTGQVSLQLLAPATGTLIADGAVLPIKLLAGGSGRYTFSGSAGQHLGLGLSGLVTTPTGGTVSLSLVAPDNTTVLLACGSYSADGSCNFPALPSDGTYTVLVVPGNANTALTGNLTLSNDAAAVLTANATATNFATTRVGQNGRYTFSAVAGQNLTLTWNAATFVGSYSSIKLYGPDGVVLNSDSFSNAYNTGSRFQLTNLQQSGTYTLVVDPYGASTGQVSLQLLAPASGALPVDGAVLPVTVAAGGSGRFTFSGTAGQRLGLGISSLVTSGTGGTVAVSVISPDKVTTLINCGSYSVDGSCDLPILPSTGTYTVLMVPGTSSTTVTANLTLSNDVAATLVANQAVTAFATTRVGQNGRYTFAGAAGQNLSLAWSGLTFAGSYTTLTVYAPDGSVVTTQSLNTTSYPNGKVALANLQQSGNYTVFVTPYGASTGQLGLQLLAPASGALTIDGAPLAVNVVAGSSGRYTFDAVIGQRLGLGLSGLVTTPAGGSVAISLVAPDNVTTVFNCATYTVDGSCNLPRIASNGTYTVVLTPGTSATALSANLTLSNDVAGTLTPDAPLTNFVTAKVGQNGRYTFSATAGQNLTLLWSGTTFAGSYSYVSVYAPDGTVLLSQPVAASYSPTGRYQMNNLQQSGTYTVFVDPYAANVGQIGVQLLAPAAGTLVVDDAPLAVSLAAGGSGRYTFNGTAGQRLGLGLSGLTVSPSGGTVTVSVIAPDGNTVLITCGTYSANGSCDLPLLPSTGKYTVLAVVGTYATSLTANLTLSSELTATLVANDPVRLFATSRVGQNGRYSFDATAGQNLTLAWSGTTLVGSYSYLTVTGPNGVDVISQYFDSSSYPTGKISLSNLQQSGTYTVFVNPYAASTGQVGLQLLAPASGVLSIDGSPTALAIVAGGSGRYTFSGTLGQRLGLGLSGLISTPTGGSATISLIGPDNVTTLLNCGGYSADGNCNLPRLPSTGTYTVLVTPGSSLTALSGTLTLSNDAAAVLTANAAVSIFSTSRPGQNGRYTFDAVAGQNLTVAWTGATFVGAYSGLTIYNPDGTTLTSTSFSNTYNPGGRFDLTNLQQGGTYTVFVDPINASVGQVGLQLLQPASGTLPVDGASLAISQVAGGSGRYTFSGSAGQRLGLGVGNLVSSVTSGYAAVSVLAPDGVTTLISCGTYYAGESSCDLPLLPSTGTYTVLVVPGTYATAVTANLTLSSDIVGTLVANDPALTFATTRAGQNGRYTFSATAGQNLSLLWKGATLVGTYSYVTVYDPSGASVFSQPVNNVSYPSGKILLSNLQQSGAYTVFVNPFATATGQVGLQLLNSASGTVSIDGVALSISQLAGASGRYTFNGTAGQRLGLGVSSLVVSGGGSATVSVIAPDNATTLVSCGGYSADGSCNLPALPSTGTYTILVVPSTYGTAVTANLLLSSDLTGSLEINGAAQMFTTDRIGQNGRYTFSATAGQNLALGFGPSTFVGIWSYMRVYGPNGVELGNQYFDAVSYPSGKITLNDVQQTGTYTVLVDPYGASVGHVPLQLVQNGTFTPPAGAVTATLAIDGDILPISLATGVSGRYTFTGTAGQKVSLGLASVVTAPASGSVAVSVLAPDNTTSLVTCSSASGCSLGTLPSSGTYTVLVVPGASYALTAQMNLSTDLAGTLTQNGAPTVYATARPGQNGSYSFSATAGQSLSLAWSGTTVVGAYSYITVSAPDGTSLANQYFDSASYPSGVIQLNNLQQSGTYTVYVNPYLASTGQVSLQLLAPASGSLTIDGATLAISQAAGASGRYTFSGTAGQQLGLGLSSLVFAPTSGSATVSVLAPDQLTTLVSCSNSSGCNLPVLPSTGTYTVLVVPGSAATAVSGNMTLSSDLTGNLVANAAATNFSSARPGQNGRYTFSASAGQNLNLLWSGLTVPGSYTYVTVYAPNGVSLVNQYMEATSYPSGTIALNNLQQSGTYTAYVNPYNAAVGQVNLQLVAPAAGTLTVDGAVLPISQQAGASGRYTFTGVAGQRLGLGLSAWATLPSNGTVTLSVLAPDGLTTLVNCSSFAGNGACDLPLLPASGTYTVLVVPAAATTAVVANLTLSSDLVATLTANQPATLFASSRVGQNGRFTFDASAGQSLSLSFSGATIVGPYSSMTVYGPNGAAVVTAQSFDQANIPSGKILLNNLQQSGTYTVFINPYGAATGQVSLQLLAPASGVLTVDGAALAINQVAGASGRYTFDGVQGQQLGLGLSNLVTTPSGGTVAVSVLAPDGVTTFVTCTSSSSCNLPQLTASGSYTVLLVPGSAATALTGSLMLSNDLTGNLVANAAASTFATSRPGQNGRYTFSVTAGQSLSLAWSGATFSASSSYLTVYTPAGVALLSQPFTNAAPANGTIDLPNLQQSGVYTVVVDPYGASVGQVSLQLLAPAAGALTIDGDNLAISQLAGQSGRYTFSGTAGQRLGLGWSGVIATPTTGTATMSVISPDNLTTLISCGSTAGVASGACSLPALPASGTYTVLVVPASASVGLNATLTLSSDTAGTLVANAPSTLFVTARPGQNARYNFTATAGQSVSLAWSGTTFVGSYTYMTVYAPDGTVLGSQSPMDSASYPSGTVQLPNLLQSGTYTVFINPYGAATGQLGVQLLAPASGALSIDGAVLPIDQIAGASGRYTFSGMAGQRLGLGLGALAAAPAGGSATISVIAPDNSTTLVSCGGYTANGSCNLPALPSSGTYTVLVVPGNAATALKAELTLSSDVAGSLVADAAMSTFATARIGQNGRYTFTAAAGDNLTLTWGGATFVGSYSGLNVYRPDGTLMTNTSFSTAIASGKYLLGNIQQAGTYTVVVDPYGAAVGQVGLQLLGTATGDLAVDGDALAISQLAGASGRYTFSGTAGQRLGLAWTSLLPTPATGTVTITVLAPDTLTALYTCGSGTVANSGACSLPALPSSGNYTVLVAPDSVGTALSAKLLLSSDIPGTLVANAASSLFVTARPGQHGRYTFDASAGQSFSLAWSGNTIPGSYSNITVYGPDGLSLTSQSIDTVSYPSGVVQMSNLLESGRYTVFVNPYGAAVGQVGLQLLAPATGTMTADGATLTISQGAGASGRYTFSGVVGQRLGLGLSGLVTAPAGGSVSLSVIAPDSSTTLVSCSSYAIDGSCNLPALPSSGTYTVLVVPGNAATAVTAALTLSNDLTGTLLANDPAVTLATTRVGQNLRYTFNANAGQELTLAWNGATYANGTLRIYSPDGTSLTTASVSTTSPSGKYVLTQLQQSGTYTAMFDPYAATTGQLGMQLLAAATGVLTVDGAVLPINQAAGGSGRYTFNGMVGQQLGLGMSGLQISGGSLTVSVQAPDGVAIVVSCGSVTADTSCNLPALPSSGVYTVLIVPTSSTAAVTGNLTLSSDVTSSLVVDAASSSFATARAGQNGRYTFNAVAGQNLSLLWSGTTFVGTSSVKVYAPTGELVASGSMSSTSSPGGMVQLMNLPKTGAYTVLVDPYGASTGQIGLQLVSADGAVLTIDGSATAVNLQPGASGRYTFTGTVNQHLALSLADLVTTPSGGSVTITLIGPDKASVLLTCGTFSAAGSCNLPAITNGGVNAGLPSDGVYTVQLTPANSTMAVKASLKLTEFRLTP